MVATQNKYARGQSYRIGFNRTGLVSSTPSKLSEKSIGLNKTNNSNTNRIKSDWSFVFDSKNGLNQTTLKTYLPQSD